MVDEDYDQKISEFEKTLRALTDDITRGAVFEHPLPSDFWSKYEGSVSILENSAQDLKKSMLILNPEKPRSIKQLHEKFIQPLNAFRETVLRKDFNTFTSKIATENLRKALMSGAEFLSLAKTIRENPSPIIRDVLKLREIFKAKDYIASIQAPDILYVRINHLIDCTKALSASLVDLEIALNTVKDRLNTVQNESSKFCSETSTFLERDVLSEETSRPPP